MSTLILDRSDLEIRLDGGALALYEPAGRRGTVPLKLLDRVVMQGGIKLDAGVLTKLAEAGVATLLLSKRHSKRVAIVLGLAHNDAGIRLAQSRRVFDPDWCAAWAARQVRAKTRAQIRLLQDALASRPDCRKPLTDALGSLQLAQSGLLLYQRGNGDFNTDQALTTQTNSPKSPFEKALFSLTGEAVGAAVPPFIKGGAGGISETAAQANVAKSPSIPLWERGSNLAIASLRGIEGAAARAYFQGLAALFPASLEFSGRNRRPPRDPVNACLSLGYTLLHFDAVRACHIAGLDPLLGFYHRPSFGRESLASDLIEPLRPHLDRQVWHLFRDRILRADHFSQDKGACLLGKAGRAAFYQDYESHAAATRRLLLRQCRILAKHLKAEGEPLLSDDEEESF
ncbi:MAG: CRISPR-associated endonuclease Cas1 [Pseudomonadota bacterium]|nr:CRISPR-associated endonuclease Cas1 [Pseudomonadota bacterium]MDP1906643.1 CRISPR-associated endonuclease Cas1 [Pseudomonadota bacterium]MDP2354062.1 CRISPR-associated endonuclease Cas1 [Pseudomonadota bacterium]